jgi:hypothetical protein
MEIAQRELHYHVFRYLFTTLRSLRKDNTRIFNMFTNECESWSRDDPILIFCVGRNLVFPNNTLDFFLFEIVLVN